MVEIKVRAADSALAMEEVQKRLGDDALIISTTKKDGQIEIIATNEEIIQKQNELKPLLLEKSFRKQTFQEALRENINYQEISKNNKVISGVDKSFENIYVELDALRGFVKNIPADDDTTIDTKQALLSLGFTKELFKRVPEIHNDLSLEAACAKIAKLFVNGKCRKFEESNIFIIAGSKNSGKSIFTKKFERLMQAGDNTRNFIKVNGNDKRSLNAALRKFNKASSSLNNDTTDFLLIEFLGEANDIDVAIVDIESKISTDKLSVIRTIPVGSSYEFFIKNIRSNSVRKEYIAFTKLDLCDISTPEIAAMLESSQTCMFFSGIDKLDDGLFFARVDQIKSHLLNKIKQKTE